MTGVPPVANSTNRYSYQGDNQPNQHDIFDHLAQLHAQTAGRQPLPDAVPILPPPLPQSMCDTEFANMSSIGLTKEDMDPSKPLKPAVLNKLLTAAQIKNYRALGLAPPMQYRVHTLITKFHESAPSLSRGQLYNIAIAADPVKIITEHSANNTLMTDKTYTTGIPVIPDPSHANDCRCQALYSNNNYTTLQPIRACLPKALYRKYPEDPDRPSAQEMGFSMPEHKNISDIYASELSCSGTVLMHLVRRAPVAQLTRSSIIYKKPQFSHINIEKSPVLAAAIAAQLERNEVTQYTSFLNKPPCTASNKNISRFQPLTRLRHNIDVESYGPEITSIEDIVINEPLVEPFFGAQSCCFCSSIIFLSDAACLLNHYMEAHMDLIHAFISCPACLIPKVMHASQYSSHYAKEHAATLLLMAVLSETHVHSRTQQAHVLNLFLLMGRKFADTWGADENAGYASYLGGFTMSEPEALEDTIFDLQNDVYNGYKEKNRPEPRKYTRDKSPEWETYYRRSARSDAKSYNKQFPQLERERALREESIDRDWFEQTNEKVLIRRQQKTVKSAETRTQPVPSTETVIAEEVCTPKLNGVPLPQRNKNERGGARAKSKSREGSTTKTEK